MQHPKTPPVANPVSTLCAVTDLAEGTTRGFEICGVSLLAVRYDGQFYVYNNSCPHLGIELNWQPDQFLDHDATFIQCSTHGALFQIDTGHCIAGPCRGKYLQAIPHKVVDGLLQIQTPTTDT